MLAPIAWVCALVVAPALALRLDKLKEESTGCYVFAGTRGVMKGKKIYFRARVFERIERLTGIKLRPRDLRDYFLGEIVPKTDQITSMHMMRHSSLVMTPVYGRVVPERMKDAVKDFGKCGGTILKGSFAKIGQMMPGRSLHHWNTSESTRKDGCFGRFWESALLLLWVVK